LTSTFSERACFTAGSELTVFTIEGRRVALLICYDVEFPEAVRAVAATGAEVVIVPTALSEDWPFVARKMVPTRAFENGMFLLYANHAGREGAVMRTRQSLSDLIEGRPSAADARAKLATLATRLIVGPLVMSDRVLLLEPRVGLATLGARH